LSKENNTVAYQFDCSCTGSLQLGNALVLGLLDVFKDPAPDPIRFGEDGTFSCEFHSKLGAATLISLKHTKNQWLYHVSALVATKKTKTPWRKL
jgi:hypothetical protein